MMFMAVSAPAKAQAVFGAYLHEIVEKDATDAKARAWATEAEAWAATVRGNIAVPETENGKNTADNNAAWLQMIARTEELVSMQQERALALRNFSDAFFAREKVSELWEDVSRARANAAFAQQMALEAQDKENMARAQSDSLKEELGDWEYERWSEGWQWERAKEAQGVAYKAWIKAANEWDNATRSLGWAVEKWDETLPMEVSDLFDVLQEHLTPEGVIVLAWEDLPVYPMVDVAAFQNVGAFNFSGDINEHIQFGQFVDRETLWATDIELGDYLLEVPPGCVVSADALPGSETRQDFVACLISFLSFYCPPGAYIFKINNEYHAWSSNVACATRD